MKKIIALIIGVILVISLCACGNGKKCENCGKTAENGYEIAERFYCEDCLF